MINTLSSLSRLEESVKNMFFILFDSFKENGFKLSEVSNLLPDYTSKRLTQMIHRLKKEELIEVKKSIVDSRVSIYNLKVENNNNKIKVIDCIEILSKIFDYDVTLILTFYKYISELSKTNSASVFSISTFLWNENFYTSISGEELVNSLIQINNINNNYFENLDLFINKIRSYYSEGNKFKIHFLIYVLNNINLLANNKTPDLDSFEDHIKSFLTERIQTLAPSSLLEIVSEQSPKLLNIVNKDNKLSDINVTYLDKDKASLERYKILSLIIDNKKVNTFYNQSLFFNKIPKADVIICKPKFNQKLTSDLEDEFKNKWKVLFDKNDTYPPTNNLDWGWVQILDYLSNESAFIILDTGALVRSGKEKEIRKKLVSEGVISSVTLIEKTQNEKSKDINDSSVTIIETRKNRKRSTEIVFSQIIIDNSLDSPSLQSISVDYQNISIKDFNLNPREYLIKKINSDNKKISKPNITIKDLFSRFNSIFNDLSTKLNEFGITTVNSPLNNPKNDLFIIEDKFEFIRFEEIVRDIKVYNKKFQFHDSPDKNLVGVKNLWGVFSYYQELNYEEVVYIENPKTQDLVTSGEIVIDLSKESVGDACIIPDGIADKLILSEGLISMTINENIYNKELLVFLLNSRLMRNELTYEISSKNNKLNIKKLFEVALPKISPENTDKILFYSSLIKNLEEILNVSSRKLFDLKNNITRSLLLMEDEINS